MFLQFFRTALQNNFLETLAKNGKQIRADSTDFLCSDIAKSFAFIIFIVMKGGYLRQSPNKKARSLCMITNMLLASIPGKEKEIVDFLENHKGFST